MLNFNVILRPTTRITRSQMFFKIGALKNFAKFTGKHLHQGLFFNKVAGHKFAGLRSATLLKKRIWLRYFSMNFEKFFRTNCFLRIPPMTGSVQLYQKRMDLKAFLIDFYVEHFSFRVTLSSYLPDQKFLEIVIFLNSYP